MGAKEEGETDSKGETQRRNKEGGGVGERRDGGKCQGGGGRE